MNKNKPAEGDKRPDAPISYSVQAIVAMAGGPRKVAERFGLVQQTVNAWSIRIPGIYAREVAIMAGLPIELVRPDFVSPKSVAWQKRQLRMLEAQAAAQSPAGQTVEADASDAGEADR